MVKNIGYLSVSIFGQKTYSQFKDALTKLEKQDMDSLIIDLRGNTGGYLSTVTNMLEEFIDKGNVIYQIQSSSGVKQYKTVKASEKKYKIVVLIVGWKCFSIRNYVSCYERSLWCNTCWSNNIW